MVFHMRNNHMQTLTLKIDDAYNLVRVDEFYLIGLILGINLNWRKHQISVQKQLAY